MTTKEVVLDLVVRDKKGRLVRDLEPGDIQVYEDGVKQNIKSFRNINGREQLDAERTAARMAVEPGAKAPGVKALPELTFVSIVFAPMAPHNFDFARQAVLAFLKTDSLPNTYVTIYRLDNRLRVIQPYTQDLSLLSRAANEATRILSSHAESAAPAVLSTQASTAAMAGAAASSTPGGSPLAQPSLQVNDPTFQRYGAMLDASTSVGAASQAQAQLENRLRFVESYATGMTTADNLRELVQSQARLQGHKIVLYLSDGLALPLDRSDVFDKLVSDANRAGVTFYTVDTRGLSDVSPVTATVAQMNQVTADRSMQDASVKGTITGSASFDAMRQSDDVQRLGVTNTQQALQELAARTGGSATANTNEIAGPMQKVMENIRTHYELTYTPSSDVYDGHFRRIEVKIDRPKVTVQSRRGYFALPELNGQPLQPFELAALNAINTRPFPKIFPYETALMEFRPERDAVQCEIAFEVPVSSLSFQSDPKTGKSRLRAAVFALVQDAQGQVVDKIGREFYREVPTAQVAALKDQQIDYAELLPLAPGHYTISTVVSDEKLERVTVKRFTAYVAPVGVLRLSSLGIVKRADPLTAPRDPLNPLEVEGRRLTLALTDSVSPGKPIPLFFVVYPGSGAAVADPLKLTVQLFRDGKEIARLTPDLPKPDSTGSIPVLAQLTPPAGSYDVRVTVRQGASIAQTNSSLTVE